MSLQCDSIDSESLLRAGLSKRHNGPKTGILTVHLGGSSATLKCTSPRKVSPARTTVPRGKISTFSRKSRFRLAQELAKVRRTAPALHVTLTYPAAYSSDPKGWKRHKKVFVQRLNRDFRNLSGFWKLEFQLRGAPHFHFVLWGHSDFGRDSMLQLRSWVSTRWYEVVGSGDTKHLDAGTRVERFRNEGSFIGYFTHTLKAHQTLEAAEVGRYWGYVQKQRIPFSPAVEIAIPDTASFDRVRRALRRTMVSKSKESRIGRVANKMKLEESTIRSLMQSGCLRGVPRIRRLRNNESITLFLNANEHLLASLTRLVDAEPS